MVQYVQLDVDDKNASKLRAKLNILAITKIILAVLCLVSSGIISKRTSIYPQLAASVIVFVLAVRTLVIINSKAPCRALVRYNISLVVTVLIKLFLFVKGVFLISIYSGVDQLITGILILLTTLRVIILILMIVIVVCINKLAPKNIARTNTNISRQPRQSNAVNQITGQNVVKAPVMVQQPHTVAMVQQPNGVMMQQPNGVMVQQPNGMMVQQPNGIMMQQPNGIMIQQPNGVMIQQPNGMMVQQANGMMVQQANGMMVQQPNGVMVQQPNGMMVQQPNGMMVQQANGMVMMQQPQAVVQQNNKQTESTVTEPANNQTNQLEKTDAPPSYS